MARRHFGPPVAGCVECCRQFKRAGLGKDLDHEHNRELSKPVL